jgi:CrcB protein
MNPLILVGIGGAAGSILRYVLQRQLNADFPLGTITVNILGCLLIGVLWALVIKNELNDTLRIALMTGFCGGFTTFSSFTLESLQLLQHNRYLFFTVYTISNVVIGLLATFAGYKIFSNI